VTANSVLIIGGGAIAGGYDADRVDSLPLTHAGAFSRDARFRLAAVVEPNQARRAAFQHRWGIPVASASLEDLAAGAGAFDVISICSPTAFHADHLAAAIQLKPRLIFAEKPLAGSLDEVAALVERCESEGIRLAVNYTRRWDPETQKLARQLRDGVWGKIRNVAGIYTKGVVHNGSHMIDLLRLLLGDLSITCVGLPLFDHWPDDPTVSASLVSHEGVPVQLGAGHAGDYALFELSLTTEHGQIRMIDGGMGWGLRRTGDSPHFAGYRALSQEQFLPGGYPHAMINAADNIAGALRDGEPLACTGRDAMAAQTLCAQIKDLALAAHANGLHA
jgi:predicted dehydrogenase